MNADAQAHRGEINFPQEPHEPEKKIAIAATNRIVTGSVASKCNDALRNNTAITVQMSSAVVVQSVMAALISFARRERIARSERNVASSSEVAPSGLSSNTRARSMICPAG